jgi:hypothetical protein
MKSLVVNGYTALDYRVNRIYGFRRDNVNVGDLRKLARAVAHPSYYPTNIGKPWNEAPE